MKKVLFVTLLVILCVSLAACGSSGTTPANSASKDNTSNINASEQQTPPQNTAEPEIILSDDGVFDHLFVIFAGEVGKMTYSECVSMLEKEGYTFEKTDPSNIANGQIDVHDDNGFDLQVYFSQDSRNNQTVSLVSYNNGIYEASVTDMGHNASITYGTFDSTRTPVNKRVSSLKDLISFMKIDVPKSMEKYAEENKENEMIEVSLDVTGEMSGGKLYFTILTNLPDETELMLTLTHPRGMAQDKVTVYGGKAKSGGFTNKGSQISGTCTLNVCTPYPNVEPRSVQKIIGSNGEYLTGPFVVKDGPQNRVEADFNFKY